MRVADAIFERLKKETDVVFMVPGGGAMYLTDALGRSGLRHVSALHEQGAGAMALGYAMASGKLGVVLTTSGPGATNAITPCLAAWMDSIPCLFISGQAKTETLIGDSGLRTRGVQEAPTIDIVRPITKFATEPIGPQKCLDALDSCIFFATTPRYGPAWLSIPMDIQGQEL